MLSYIVDGAIGIALGCWVVLIINYAIKAVSMEGFWWLLAGGIAYTIGAVLYAIGGKFNIKYVYSVYHLFVILGSFLQFFCIILYVFM